MHLVHTLLTAFNTAKDHNAAQVQLRTQFKDHKIADKAIKKANRLLELRQERNEMIRKISKMDKFIGHSTQKPMSAIPPKFRMYSSQNGDLANTHGVAPWSHRFEKKPYKPSPLRNEIGKETEEKKERGKAAFDGTLGRQMKAVLHLPEERLKKLVSSSMFYILNHLVSSDREANLT